ncbi:MAG: DNA polymerase domain-containing protein, partial [Candidatus Geothermarchaeales archaeon]
NRVIDSRNCYELIQRGYVIKEDHGHYEWARPIRQVYERDVGGIIFAPRIGVVHENVGEIDFESMYPQLMVKYCISYETVKPDGTHPRDDALLPGIVGEILKRRLYFKRMRKKFPEESREWRWCEQRQQSLKLVLVCAYGTAGCCWNRFGNVLAFEEINKRSREAMIKAVHLIQGLGYEVVYGDTDSLFIKKKGALREDYERLCDFVGEEIGLPVGLDHHYRFLLLLSSKTDPTGLMEAQKHYLGLLTNGEVVARGVEIRRHDTPLLIKNFQLELIQRLLGWETAGEVVTKGFEVARAYIRETVRKVMEGGVPLEDLVITKYLRKPISAYKSGFPHVSAARQLTERGKLLKKGEKVAYVFVDADHDNPLCRVQAVEDLVDVQRYDTDKYRDMVLDAAETVLSQLGFSKREFDLEEEDQKTLLKQETEQKAHELGHWVLETRDEGAMFVVQRQQATEVHYALGLERDGVLKSWTLSKEPPLEAGVRRPAIQLGDHSAEQAGFKSSLASGDNEVGVVETWDGGTYTAKVWSRETILFHMDGERMKGDYLLRRVGEGEKEDRWILLKRREMKI